MSKTDVPIVVSQEYNSSIESIWKAISECEEMKQWFFDNIPSFNPKIGFKTGFMVQTSDRSFYHLWEIIDVVPLEKLSIDWQYKEYPGRGLVTFSLTEDNDKCRLVVTSEGMSSFPQDIPEFSRESCEAGWQYFIQDRLKNYLDQQ